MTYLRSVGVGFVVLLAIAVLGVALGSLPAAVPAAPAPEAPPQDVAAPGSSPTLGLGAEWTYIELRETSEADRGNLFPGLNWLKSLKAKRFGSDLVLERHEADLKDRAMLEGFLAASGTAATFGQNKAHWVAHPRLGAGLLFIGIREAAFLISPSLSPTASVPDELASYLATISVP